jgi:hypothetical protein
MDSPVSCVCGVLVLALGIGRDHGFEVCRRPVWSRIDFGEVERARWGWIVSPQEAKQSRGRGTARRAGAWLYGCWGYAFVRLAGTGARPHG